MNNSRNDYVYSLVANENPWIVYTLTEKEYNELREKEQMKCVYLPDLSQEVYKALNLPDASELLLSTCRKQDVESWIESPKEIIKHSDRLISATIDGVKYTIRESMPYICFLGATVIGNLFRSEDPLSFDILEHNDRMDFIVPGQLKYLYGVFQFELHHNIESHGFVLYMTKQEIIVYNSYGVTVGFFVTSYKRESWLNLFINFFDLPLQKQLRYYPDLWGFTSDMTDWVSESIKNNKIRRLEFVKLVYHKIY